MFTIRPKAIADISLDLFVIKYIKGYINTIRLPLSNVNKTGNDVTIIIKIVFLFSTSFHKFDLKINKLPPRIIDK